MCCTEFIVKYALFFFNLVFTLAGVVLIAVGVAVILTLKDILDLIPVNINILPISVIVIGVVVFIIAFFGCCGAIKESGCLLVMYAICMVILAALKITLTVIIFQSVGKLQSLVEDWLTKAFNQESLRTPFNALETLFSCCGTVGANTYVSAGLPVPGSCCGNEVNVPCTGATYGGCTEKLGSYLERYGDAVGSVLVIVIAVELVALLFSLYLRHTISNNKRRATY